MVRALCIASLLVLATLTNVRALQEQEIDTGPSELSTEIKVLQKNITDLWNYIYELRNAMSDHLLHLKQHQMEIATVLHDLTHHSGGDNHHHHSSSKEESHSHMEDHSHGSSHEHVDDHHHDDHHQEESHHHHHEDSTADSHAHDDGHHHHEQSKNDHHHHDSGDDHHHHHDSSDEHHHHHEESNEKHDSKEHQQMHQQEELAEKVIVATNASRHNHHHHHNGMDPLNILNTYHGHGRSFSRSARNLTYIPSFSESSSYYFAICDVKPNTAIESELQQDVRGQVSFWQSKQGGDLGIHVRLSGFKMDSHSHHQQQQQHHHGAMHDVGAQDTANTMSHKHGFHIHELGDLSNSCESTGPHYVPKSSNHGSPHSSGRHVGDLGNIECDNHGNTNIVFSDRLASLTGPYSIINRALVIHSNPDDYANNHDDPESMHNGNAGTRIACCVIQRVDRLPIRTQKSLKIAKQYKQN